MAGPWCIAWAVTRSPLPGLSVGAALWEIGAGGVVDEVPQCPACPRREGHQDIHIAVRPEVLTRDQSKEGELPGATNV